MSLRNYNFKSSRRPH